MNGEYAIQVYSKTTFELVASIGNEKLVPEIMQAVQLGRLFELTNCDYENSAFKISEIELKRLTLTFADSEDTYLVLFSHLETFYAIELCEVLLANFEHAPRTELMVNSIGQALSQILKSLQLQGQIHHIELLNHEEENENELIEHMISIKCEHVDLFLTKNKRMLIYCVSNCTVLLFLNRKQQMDEYGAAGSLGWARNELICRLIVKCVNEASGVLASYGVEVTEL